MLPPNELGIQEYPGWNGVFTRKEAPGAMPNGTRIQKTNSEAKDSTPDGTGGTILGSVHVPELKKGIFYFVEWDNRPRYAVGVMELKLMTAKGTA